MENIAPYPPATIPPSEYYTPTPIPALSEHLPSTGTYISEWWVVVGVALIIIGLVSLVVSVHRRRSVVK